MVWYDADQGLVGHSVPKMSRDTFWPQSTPASTCVVLTSSRLLVLSNGSQGVRCSVISWSSLPLESWFQPVQVKQVLCFSYLKQVQFKLMVNLYVWSVNLFELYSPILWVPNCKCGQLEFDIHVLCSSHHSQKLALFVEWIRQLFKGWFTLKLNCSHQCLINTKVTFKLHNTMQRKTVAVNG